MNEFTFTPDEYDNNKRLDVFLTERLSGYSRSSVQHLVDRGLANVCGKPVKSNYRVSINKPVNIQVPDPAPADIKPEPISLDILYEDKDIIVINKPQGMVVHPAAGNLSGTLANALKYHCDGSLSGINGELRPGIVHRIDKDTSGVLVAAKNDAAHRSLSAQLHEHTVERVYSAIACGLMKQCEGQVNKPIGRSPRDRKKMAVVPGGKNAVTYFKVLEGLRGHTLLELRLKTGRTHQIRVHMSYLGFPLYGDRVYGSREYPAYIKGQALHAKTLGFVHPCTNEYMMFDTPLPDYFINILEGLR